MKKLIDSRDLWLLTAFVFSMLLPLLCIASYVVLLTSNYPPVIADEIANDIYRDVGPMVKFGTVQIPTDMFFWICVFEQPPGLILGGCYGYSLYLWRQKSQRSSRAAKHTALYGAAFVFTAFALLPLNVQAGGVEALWAATPIMFFPMFFAFVLFLWGLHLPPKRPELLTQNESSAPP